MPLSEGDLAIYRHCGHVTLPGLFDPFAVNALVDDIQAWGESFLAELPAAQRAWYVDGGVKSRALLRKLDNPHHHRAAVLSRQPMTPAPVRRGGVSFHHGNTFHQSAPNLSPHWRRACAFHYVNERTFFEHPALPYDESLKLRVS